MPEAVASTSIPVSARQPSEWTASGILDALSEAEDAFYALGDMAGFDMEQNSDPKVAAGFSYLIRRETEELAVIRKVLRELLIRSPQGQLDRANAGLKQAIWSDLFIRVSGIVRQAMEDAGRYVPEENSLLWSEQDIADSMTITLTHYLLIMDRLKGSMDPFEAGSFLPWAELLIRKALGCIPVVAPTEQATPKTLRDAFIAQKHQEGHSASDISQALSLRQSTVLRTIDRLTGMVEEGDCKAI